MLQQIHKNKLSFYNKNIGKNIKYYRKVKEISQEEIASILGVDKSTISLYENGKINIPVKYLYAISLQLDVSIETFFDNYNNKFKSYYHHHNSNAK